MSPADLEPIPGPPPDAAAAPADAAPADAAEAEAWAAVLAAWEDEAAHRAYLARFADLEGLAVAGRRYRAVLAARPADAVAARWRDEVVKRATVAGLALLPRTRPPPLTKVPRTLRNVLLAACFALVLGYLLASGREVVDAMRALWPR